MMEPSTDYNKGYQKPGTNPWNAVTTNCESRKHEHGGGFLRHTQVLTIDPDFLDDLEIHFLSDVGNDSERASGIASPLTKSLKKWFVRN